MAHWHNTNEQKPPSMTQFIVTNSPDGGEYKARYNGEGRPWTIISFSPGVDATEHPKYWCDQRG